MSPATAGKLAALQALLRPWPRIVVLLSGGVDSALLLQAAVDILGSEVLAVTFTGPHTPAEEVATARALTQRLGVLHRLEPFDPFLLPDFRQNTPQRCYACKEFLYRRSWEIAQQLGAAAVLDGANADDDAGDRPGLRAAAVLGVSSPLRATGWHKSEIRELARSWDLPGWDRPAQSCLATRFPPYTLLTPQDLQHVEVVESFLRRQGFGPVRLRCHGDLVRLELPAAQWPQLLQPQILTELQHLTQSCGWRFLTLDLQGYQSGSMNAPDPEQQGEVWHP
ncbi:MAG: ATP-dependent sacrificial sulfur transferase LarE [Desulfobacca sp.]|uniref:ATP-dependent sacrificial sulfur transferase LarE n=1 Tax=Desulfobacca sp. TaxID=2067990 RepID=UPI004049B756